ncbi:unnamed protein product [Clonostachys solani]|uniref:Uncharacterized protein n=1 Tax=Clonostachys solani TaxID=160281 RepID=A0A9N9Z3V4_9HYPO|nr:unnamed protein product [Clonostachys solani]
MAGIVALHGMAPNQRDLGNPTPGCCWLAATLPAQPMKPSATGDTRRPKNVVSVAWTHVGETPALWREDSVGGPEANQSETRQAEAIAVMMEVAGHASGRQLPSCSSLVASPLTVSRSSGTWQMEHF